MKRKRGNVEGRNVEKDGNKEGKDERKECGK